MITIIKELQQNKIAVTAKEKSDLSISLNYSFKATNLQTGNLVAFPLTNISLFTNRYDLFEIDGNLFEENEYLYEIIQTENQKVVETGKLLVISSINTDIYR